MVKVGNTIVGSNPESRFTPTGYGTVIAIRVVGIPAVVSFEVTAGVSFSDLICNMCQWNISKQPRSAESLTKGVAVPVTACMVRKTACQ